MQDSLTMLCCGAIFGVLAVVIVMALLKKRGSVSVQPPSSTAKAPAKSVEGKHLAEKKSVEGKHLAQTKSVEGKHLAEKASAKSKHVAEPIRTKDVAKKHVERPASKGEYHPAKPEGSRSKSTYKQVSPADDDSNDDNPRFRKD